MPKVPTYTLTWSSSTQAYILCEGPDQRHLSIVPGSSTWYAWLDHTSCFAFAGKAGHYTARKARKQRGTWYWYAYFPQGGQRTKAYLGRTSNLTLATLEQVAHMVLFRSSGHGVDTPRARKRVSPAERELSEAQLPPSLEHVTGQASLQGDGPGRMKPLPLLDPRLATKLHLPRPRARLVPRPRLLKRLSQGMEAPLTLVSAPAGFGKTTLLSQWVAHSGVPGTWLSLDPGDNDPVRFLSGMIAALQRLDPRIGMTARALLHTPQPAPPEAALALLINDVARREGEKVALVLDDYHVIGAPSIHRALAYFMEHLPPQIHLILATRTDPPLPLARLRAHGQLTEVRAAELRFDTQEVSVFLRIVSELALAPPDIALLEHRTEGWVAGLQLAALSVRDRAEVSALLASFTGSHRFVLDYLSEEVLSRLDAPTPSFLAHTCVLERLCGSLCDAMTRQQDKEVSGQQMLEALEQANLFVVPLDEAEQQLAHGMRLLEGTTLVDADVISLGYMALARLKLAHGQAGQALATLDAFDHLARTHHFVRHLVDRGIAMRAQVELSQGKLIAAIGWADASGLPPDDTPSYQREREYLILARVRIAQGRRDLQSPFLQEALHLLERLLHQAEINARVGSVLEILLVRALALDAPGKRHAALEILERALRLGAPEGYVRLFVDEGAPMRVLLRLAHGRGITPDYVATLLLAFEEQYPSDHPFNSYDPKDLVDPLTARECEVLRLLEAGASNRTIAQSLVLSLGTVKKHVSNIYGKLGVQSRIQAVARARVLPLL